MKREEWLERALNMNGEVGKLETSLIAVSEEIKFHTEYSDLIEATEYANVSSQVDAAGKLMYSNDASRKAAAAVKYQLDEGRSRSAKALIKANREKAEISVKLNTLRGEISLIKAYLHGGVE